MEREADVIIIGGGLAGLTCALHLNKLGKKVLLFEKNEYPHHKVCGEYISNEVVPYLQWLGVDPEILKPTHIHKFQFSTENGKSIHSNLPLGGFGISRYALDLFLYETAIAQGCETVIDTVTDVSFKTEVFTVTTSTQKYYSKFVLGAYGKRATLDQKLDRPFIKKKSNWLAVKAHYTGDFPKDLVALHHFKGGYCGVSKVEDDVINICYLVNYKSFKNYKDIATHQAQILHQNIHLKEILVNSKMVFKNPITISQIAFEDKEQVKDHILMVGDTAGLIHPLCGNGMSMAIHGAKICAILVNDFFDGKISSRSELEKQYQRIWNKNFKSRLSTGKLIAKALQSEKLTSILMNSLIKFPALLPIIIKKTHGKPLLDFKNAN